MIYLLRLRRIYLSGLHTAHSLPATQAHHKAQQHRRERRGEGKARICSRPRRPHPHFACPSRGIAAAAGVRAAVFLHKENSSHQSVRAWLVRGNRKNTYHHTRDLVGSFLSTNCQRFKRSLTGAPHSSSSSNRTAAAARHSSGNSSPPRVCVR